MNSYINNDLIAKAVELGADDYILKPFKIDVLVKKLIYFQRITDLEDREKKYLKFIDSVFEKNPLEERDKDVKLPLIIYSKIERNIDAYVYFFAKRENKLIELISFEDLPQLLQESDTHTIYYFKHFASMSESQKELILDKGKSLNIIIGTTSMKDVEILGYMLREIETDITLIDGGDILSVSDYIRQVILNNQYKIPDTEIARQLGISRKSLWEKRRKLNIQKRKKANKV